MEAWTRGERRGSMPRAFSLFSLLPHLDSLASHLGGPVTKWGLQGLFARLRSPFFLWITLSTGLGLTRPTPRTTKWSVIGAGKYQSFLACKMRAILCYLCGARPGRGRSSGFLESGIPPNLRVPLKSTEMRSRVH